MLQLSSTLIGQDVISLRTGGKIASGTQPIINPNNLKIEGFYCEDRFEKKTLVLLAQDIRDHVPQGFVVNDHEVLANTEELVRLQSTIKLEFALIGKQVVTVHKQKLGKVNDYAVDDMSLYIQKIYTSQGLIKTLGSGNLSIDRSQIVEITSRKVVIQDLLKPVKNTAPAQATAA